jgi:hypothetical protein
MTSADIPAAGGEGVASVGSDSFPLYTVNNPACDIWLMFQKILTFIPVPRRLDTRLGIFEPEF